MINWILKEAYFNPDGYEKTVYDIDYASLKKQGIKAILIDLDNTLIPYDETLPNQKIFDLFDSLKELDFEVVIISNNHLSRVEPFAKLVKARFICKAAKPLKYGFKRAVSFFEEIHPNEIMVIGDQFMTDVFGAKRMGFSVIVVDAIKRKVEKWYTKMNRVLEKRMIHRIKHRNIELYERLHLSEKR